MNTFFSTLKKRWAVGLLFGALAASGCANGADAADSAATLGESDSASGTDSGDSDSGDSDSDGSDVCLLHNCESDAECGGCSEGRNTCFSEDRRCVACDPGTGEGCPDGEMCTEFGSCVPEGLTCETDDEGTPTITCNDDPDCAACDPDHQVCAAGQCVACRGDSAEACTGAEICVDNECQLKCPESCTTNADCGSCGEEGFEAHACHNHKCAECSSDTPCTNGEYCTDQGVCAAICGIPGQTIGTCETDSDCAGCEGDNDNCITPINSDRGECGPSASGCSDLGNGVVVLPEPWSDVTNACSSPADCDGVGILYNVGELLRDLTGIDSIDDANIEYPMNECAAITVEVGDNAVSCGICVPCKVDDDCQDINVDQVAGDAFGPLGAIATALLLDQLFGAESHDIHMFCQPIAGDYGVCVPCPNLLNDCSVGAGGGGGSGNCDHAVDQTGGPLDPTCSSCAETVCNLDSFCCNTEWDSTCVGIAANNCAMGACHDQCEEGNALDPSCNSCVSDICDEDPFCCNDTWDALCVSHVTTYCGGQCQTGCAHDECAAGGPLEESCSSCAMEVCTADDFCCNTEWDSFCVEAAEGIAACGC